MSGKTCREENDLGRGHLAEKGGAGGAEGSCVEAVSRRRRRREKGGSKGEVKS
jgi:hypothetical protein